MRPLILTTGQLDTAYSNAALKAENNSIDGNPFYSELDYEIASFGHYVHSYLAGDQITNGVIMPVNRRSTIKLIEELDNGDLIYGIYIELKYEEILEKLLHPSLYNEVVQDQVKSTPFGQIPIKQSWGNSNVRESTRITPNYNTFHPQNSGPSETKVFSEPGVWESAIPIVGSAKLMAWDFQEGKWIKGIFNTVMLISDIFIVKAVIVGAGKVAVGTAWKTGSHSWSATRKWMLKTEQVGKGKPLHHWGISNSIGKKFKIERIVNQPWNLMEYENQAFHMTKAHGLPFRDEAGSGILARIWYGSPTGFKSLVVSSSGRIINK